MTVAIIGGKPADRGEEWVSREDLSQSTATTFVSVNLYTEVTRLGVGTATGFERNRYALPDGAEETRFKTILTTGTGEAHLYLAGTATGLFVFDDADDMVMAMFLDGKWRLIVSTATVASST
jgi:hypothetical protein